MLGRFAEYCDFRRFEQGGEHPADWRDLHAFAHMTGHTLTRLELRLFRRIENAYFLAKRAD